MKSIEETSKEPREAIDLKSKIRDIPDWPRKGVIFRDITTLLKDPRAFAQAIDCLAEKLEGKTFDAIVAIEARGYIFGAPLAKRFNVGLVPVRKLGKLPFETIQKEYELEYGKNILEIHKDALGNGQRVVIIDDLIATGGSGKATCDLVEALNAKVECFLFLIELTFFNGRKLLDNYEVHTIIQY